MPNVFCEVEFDIAHAHAVYAVQNVLTVAIIAVKARIKSSHHITSPNTLFAKNPCTRQRKNTTARQPSIASHRTRTAIDLHMRARRLENHQ
jgi:hypothetical protein